MDRYQVPSLRELTVDRAVKVDGLTTPHSHHSEGIATPPGGGIPIPHVSSMSPGTFQSSFFGTASSPPSHALLAGTPPTSPRKTTDKEKEREKALFPQRVVITSMNLHVPRRYLNILTLLTWKQLTLINLELNRYFCIGVPSMQLHAVLSCAVGFPLPSNCVTQ